MIQFHDLDASSVACLLCMYAPHTRLISGSCWVGFLCSYIFYIGRVRSSGSGTVKTEGSTNLLGLAATQYWL